MSILRHVLINSEDIDNLTSSSTLINASLLSLFLNVVTVNLSILIGVRLILDVKPNGCEVSEYISTKVEVNPRIPSTLKTQNPFEELTQGVNFRHNWLYL